MPDLGGYKRTHLVGQAGVMRVMAELMLRGVHVWLPAVDTGVDLMADNHARLQVKTTTFVFPSGRCSFRLAHGYRLGSTGKITYPARVFSQFCDFVILYCVPLSRFWIVPSRVLDGLTSCSCGEGKSTLLSRDERPEIISRRENGESWRSIADGYGVSPGLIRQIFGSPFYSQQSTRTRKSIAGQINEYEGCWDSVLDFCVADVKLSSVVPIDVVRTA
jgi:hypothetical protein